MWQNETRICLTPKLIAIRCTSSSREHECAAHPLADKWGWWRFCERRKAWFTQHAHMQHTSQENKAWWGAQFNLFILGVTSNELQNDTMGKSLWQEIRPKVWPLLHSSCVNLNEFLNLSGPWLPCLQKGYLPVQKQEAESRRDEDLGKSLLENCRREDHHVPPYI